MESNKQQHTRRQGDMSTIDQLTSRHIARLLCRLGETIAPVVESEIKREFRFLAEDIKQVINTEISSHDEAQIQEANGNY